jgi:hypothetical protein
MWALLVGTLTVAGCSHYWGVELVLVGEVPPDIKSIVGDAAASAGFTEDFYPHSAPMKRYISRYMRDLPEDWINFDADFRNGQYVVVVGCMNHAFRDREEKAFISVLRNLRGAGLQFVVRRSSMVRLPPDLREWLKAGDARGSE